MSAVKVSVVVATRNRAKQLSPFLNNFARMAKTTKTPWELILVDNNSTDATRGIVGEFIHHQEIPLTYLFEARPGKSNALNAGIKCAEGDIIALTDDDCYVAEDWVDAIAQEFNEQEALGGLGGRVELFDPAALPIATRTLRTRRRMSRVAQLFSLIIGCNMAFRRSALNEIGLFDPLFGPGARIPAAEDIDVVHRVFRAGIRLEYTPDVLVYHDHGRVSEIDRSNTNRGYVLGRGAFYRKFVLAGDRLILMLAATEIASLAWQFVRPPFARDNRQTAKMRLGQLVEGFRMHRSSVQRGRE